MPGLGKKLKTNKSRLSQALQCAEKQNVFVYCEYCMRVKIKMIKKRKM